MYIPEGHEVLTKSVGGSDGFFNLGQKGKQYAICYKRENLLDNDPKSKNNLIRFFF